MAGWSEHQGRAIALPFSNIDTDQILPARFMSVPRVQGYGDYLFHDLRRDDTGSMQTDLALNRFPDASVLVARRNFGTGSSREAAVYALVDAGFRAVIAPSFGDIFAANAVNNGLLPARIDEGQCDEVIKLLGDGYAAVAIDLNSGMINMADLRIGFDLDPVWTKKLVNGWDDIDLTRNESDRISAFRDRRKAQAAWTWPTRS